AAVVAGEADGVQAAPPGLPHRRGEVRGTAAGGQRDRDVLVAGAGDQLAGEDQLEPDVVAQCGEHRLIGGQAPGRQRPSGRRAGEQRRQRRGVGRTAAVAEGEQPAAGGEPACHLGGGGVEQVGVGGQRGAPQGGALGGLRLRGRGQVGQQGLRVGLLGLDERVQEVGPVPGCAGCAGGGDIPRGHRPTSPSPVTASRVSSVTLLIARPACTSNRSPASTGPTSEVSTVTVPSAVRATTPPTPPGQPGEPGESITSARQPSSLQVMHTSSVHSGSRSSPGCSKQTWVSSHSRWYSSTNPPVAGMRGSGSSSHSTWSAAPAGGRAPWPIHTVVAPQAGARSMADRTSGWSAPQTAS